MKKEKQQSKKGQIVACVLKGTSQCPKPKECNGMERQCNAWFDHSGR